MSEMGKSFMGYHWHGDYFDLPKGASALASSELTACQAFAYGPKAYGILFHMEVTEQIIGDMVRRFDDEVREEGTRLGGPTREAERSQRSLFSSPTPMDRRGGAQHR